MSEFEKPGLFYLGKTVNSSTGKPSENVFLYPSKNLTTHAVCVGMTGSGKTGLGIALLEEAALDNIPALIIDPKGDLTNLLLTFPHLSAEEFKPWIDLGEAERKGMSEDQYAEFIAKIWREGLASWGEDADRIKRLRKSVDFAIYTPASQAGIPISILSSFAAPPKEQLLDASSLRDNIQSTAASLLALIGIVADPIKSREHILISTIIQHAWQNGTDLNIAALIQSVQNPPMTKIGALDLDTFYPPKDRIELSIKLNNLLASPGFQAWMEGVPLDIQSLLYAKEGKPKLSILSIAHLSDTERMFFVTLFLNQVLTWMRRQPGTSSLRALLYMDEIFGFFPPSAAPPSKLPMLTLLKQARAFGLGVVLATQNPVDLDYKGLANCGTWFIGKLQTERDRSRVIEGLKVASNSDVEAKSFDNMIASTGNRTFIMRSIYEASPILFQTRWTLSYLRGPLTLAQIAGLSHAFGVEKTTTASISTTVDSQTPLKPNVSPGIAEFYVHPLNRQRPVHYEPKIVGIAKLHFVDAKHKIDTWEDLCLVSSADEEGKSVLWEKGENLPSLADKLAKEAIPEATFSQLPPGLMQEKSFNSFSKDFAAFLYQNQTYPIYQTTDPPMSSEAGESEADFRQRVAREWHDNREGLVKKVEEKYREKKAALSNKIARAQGKLTQRKQKAWLQKLQTIISFIATCIGALLGRGITKGTISQTGTSLRRATQIGKDSQEASQAEEEVGLYQQQMEDLDSQMKDELASIQAEIDPAKIEVNTISIRPRKSDISVEKIALIWWAS